MSTIKRLLVTVLISGNIVVVGMGLFYGHSFITTNLNKLFDAHLVDETQVVKHILSELNTHPIGTPHNDRLQHYSLERSELGLNHLRVQVSKQLPASDTSKVIYSSNGDAILLTVEGFHNFTLDDEDWRSFGHYDAANRIWILVADRMENRLTSVNSMFLQLGGFLILGLFILFQVISIAIYYGLKPVQQLTAALRLKKADDLSPLTMKKIPQELVPLTNAMNALLSHLKDSRDRELQFSGDVAHELRNPLAGIRVNLENLFDELSVETETASHLQQGIRRMENIVEQILILNRIAPSVFMAKFDDFNLHDAVDEVLLQLDKAIEGKGHELTVKRSPGSLTIVRGERHSIEILIRNLVTNAIKYSPPSSKIHIGLQDNEDGITLEVMDSGPGIPSSERAQIFQRFYRAGGDCHSSGVEGCGLGLSIVKKIANLHRSVILVGDSIFSSGVSVKVIFPKA